MSRKQQHERDNREERPTEEGPNNLDDGRPGAGGDSGQDNYEIGYRKPPKHTRFQNGNKLGKGRPKRSQNMKSLVNEAANDKAPVKINGKVKKVGKGKLAVQQVFNRAAAGDPKFVPKAIELQERYLPQEEAPSTVPPRGDPDVETMRNYVAWHDQLPGSDEDEEGPR